MTHKNNDFSERSDALEGPDRLFVERWSPRAFDGSSIDADIQKRLFDAARWSPSCFNEQPWRFFTGERGSSTFDDFLQLLNEKNRIWAQHAALLGFIVGQKKFSRNGKSNDVFAFDCGAAWMAMTLQARREGLYTHGMAGILHEKVCQYLNLDSSEEQVIAGFAVGRATEPSHLPDEMQKQEKPSPRKSLRELWINP